MDSRRGSFNHDSQSTYITFYSLKVACVPEVSGTFDAYSFSVQHFANFVIFHLIFFFLCVFSFSFQHLKIFCGEKRVKLLIKSLSWWRSSSLSRVFRCSRSSAKRGRKEHSTNYRRKRTSEIDCPGKQMGWITPAPTKFTENGKWIEKKYKTEEENARHYKAVDNICRARFQRHRSEMMSSC